MMRSHATKTISSHQRYELSVGRVDAKAWLAWSPAVGPLLFAKAIFTGSSLVTERLSDVTDPSDHTC